MRKDVIQTLTFLPEQRNLNTNISLKSLTSDGSQLRAEVHWTLDLSALKEPKTGPVIPRLQLKTCQTLFSEEVPFPKISDDGKSIKFDRQYADHKCTFEYRLSFEIWQNETSCKGSVINTEAQALMVHLSCDKVQGMECPQPIYACNIDCTPDDLWVAPHFDVTENATEVSVNVSWRFDKASRSYAIRYYHSW